jgi:hypothetical protein
LDQHIDKENDEIVILDDFSDNEDTKKVLSLSSYRNYVNLYQHALEKNYSAHKNYGTSLCKNPWVLQIDGDENPTITLLLNIKDIIDNNPGVELFLVPRINDFRGVSHEHAKQWGWQLTPSPSCKNRLIINWPDYQGRIYKNDPKRIRWDRRLHEKLEGYTKFTPLPEDEDLALYHDKTIETQIKTNIRYNEWFSAEENQGHKGFA